MNTKTIINRLEAIYAQIPEVTCTHCHHCCGPLIWFKPEEINIRRFLQENNMKYLTKSSEEFVQQGMQCPYIKNDRCSIYPVRPIVCRLQGNTPELPCTQNVNTVIPKQILDKIKQEMDSLVRETGGIGFAYGTRRYTKEKVS